MAFGQQSGPPAQHNQMRSLLELLQDVGYSDFRDARGAMGFTQRQAGGKFTSQEAQDFIDQLEEAEHTGVAPVATTDTVGPRVKPTASEKAMSTFTDEQLAAELQRRGWIVAEP